MVQTPARVNLLYRIIWLFWKLVFFQTIRIHSMNPDMLNRRGGYVLAVTHIGHLEVVCAGVMTHRQIRWIARKEFYRHRLIALFLKAAGCIKVNRQGIPASTIRAAVRAAREGQVIGIFPEGGVVRGQDLAIRGGQVKRGMCSIAIHATVPIIPAVILGTQNLNCVSPWLPFRRGRLWIAFGDPIEAPAGGHSTRATRNLMAERVRHSMQDLYGRLQAQYGVDDRDVP